MSSSKEAIRIPRKLLDSWKNSIVKFCRTKGRKQILELKDLHGYVLSSKSDIKKLWQIFNMDRQDVRVYLKNSDRQTAAYLLGFHLPNVARTLMILSRSEDRHSAIIDSLDTIDIIDFGCGTGALTAAFLHHHRKRIKGKNLNIHLLDKQRKMAACAKTIVEQICPGASVNLWVGDYLGFIKKYKLDQERRLIVTLFGNFLNELRNPNPVFEWLHKVQSVADSEIVSLFLEPAQKHHSRQLMEWVETLNDINIPVHYPCQGAQRCPMLDRKRDWCFSENQWVVPREQKLIDRLTEMNHLKINTTGYICFQASDGFKPSARVVGKPTLLSRGQKKTNYLLCDGLRISTQPAPDGQNLFERGTFLEARDKEGESHKNSDSPQKKSKKNKTHANQR